MPRARSSTLSQLKPHWVIDLSTPASDRPRPSQNIADPPGYAAGSGSKKTLKPIVPPSQAETDNLKIKKAWEIALAPAKSLPMNAIMMYMSGNTLQIFSIMMTFMLFTNPLKALANVSNTFARYDTETTRGRLFPVKLAFIAMNLLTIALGIWKVNGMGLLPTTRSDWLAWETEPTPLETSISKFY